jgi:hypothetical protein
VDVDEVVVQGWVKDQKGSDHRLVAEVHGVVVT